MKTVSTIKFRLSDFRTLFPFLAVAALAYPAQAVSVAEDFEDDPAHAFSWVNTQNAAATANWSVLLNGSPAPLTPSRSNALAGVS